MVNKKYLLLAGLCSVFAAQPALAQESMNTSASWGSRDMTYRGDSYDVLDSSYYTGKKLDQYRRYMNHQTPFPPKPNNQWEVGVNVGFFNVFGDVVSKTPFTAKKATDAIGFGVTVRKALGHTFSLRAQYLHGTASGFNYRASNPNEAPWGAYAAPGSTEPLVYRNYRTKLNEISLQLVGAVNNINFYHSKIKMNLYGFLGGGIAMYKVDVDAMNGAALHNWSTVAGYPGSKWKDRKAANDAVKNELDGDYEANVRDRSDFVLTPGVGIQFRLSPLLTLQLEDKFSLPFADYLDGQEIDNRGGISSDKDIYNYGSIGLNFNIGNRKKNVAPLWWVNPLDGIYSELSDPRHMRLPEPILPDSDGDGVADQFDKCPGTPAGVAVDTHGCPMDTDGDGVPDYKDKQLITPTECQPVDADGVGKCPCPDGCGGSGVACGTIGAGSLNFTGSSSRITPGMQSQLSNLAAQMSANPTCKVVIIGAGNASKVQQQRSWDRVNGVIEYMSEKHGIDRNRFIFQYGAPGDGNTVMYRSANSGEEGPSNVAPPFPNLRRE